MRRLILAAALAALSSPALAVTDMSMRSGVDELSPEMRESVMQRMGPQQRPAELVETTILNNLMAEYAEVRNLELVGTVYRAEVRPMGGEWTAIEINPETYIFASN